MCVLFEVFITYYEALYYKSNARSFNLFAILCCTYYIYVYLQYFREKPWVNKIRWVAGVWLASAFAIYLITFNSQQVIFKTYLSGLFIAGGLAVTYFYDLLHKREMAIFTKPLTYFSLGIILFLTSSFPILAFIDVLIVEQAQQAYSSILRIGNIFLSLGYLGTALCLNKEAQYIG